MTTVLQLLNRPTYTIELLYIRIKLANLMQYL